MTQQPPALRPEQTPDAPQSGAKKRAAYTKPTLTKLQVPVFWKDDMPESMRVEENGKCDN